MPSAREMVLASAPMRAVSKNRTMRIVEIKSSKGSSFETVPFLTTIG